jgi:hypothetical protein
MAQDADTQDQTADEQLEPLAEELPEVTIFQRGEDTITEYRISGRLYMVKVSPPHSASYYLVDRKGNGRMVREDSEHLLAVPKWVITTW